MVCTLARCRRPLNRFGSLGAAGVSEWEREEKSIHPYARIPISLRQLRRSRSKVRHYPRRFTSPPPAYNLLEGDTDQNTVEAKV